MKMKICAFMMAIASMMTHVASGKSLDHVGNGGEFFALEFTRVGREVYLVLNKFDAQKQILSESELGRFDDALKSTRVNAVNGPVIDNSGREVDARAIYDDRYSEMVIEINKHSWEKYLNDIMSVHKLVFHEYLRVINIDDDNYKVALKLDGQPFKTYLTGRQPVLTANQDYFRQLSEYFEIARTPEWKDLIVNKYPAGTVCYDEKNTMNSFSSFLVQETFLDGPLFPVVQYFKFSNHYLTNETFRKWKVELGSWVFVRRSTTVKLRLYGQFPIMEVTDTRGSGLPKVFCYAWY